MKGLQVTAFGQPSDVIKLLNNIPKPSISKDDEILVCVHYASIHMGDWKLSNGDLGGMASLMGFKIPFIPGQDYSGKVVEIGKNVNNFKVGDAVFGQVRLGHGTCCQYIIVTEKQKEIYKIPNNLNLLNAPSAQCSYETTYQALFDYADLKKNETILILGGSTVIGMYALQIAKNHFECKNIVCTSSKDELCKSLGAHQVINYKNEQWQDVLKDSKFDIILDVMGGKQSWIDCKKNNVLSAKGRYVTVAGDFEQNEKIKCCTMCGIMCGVLNRKFWSCMGQQEYHMVNQERSKTIQDAIKLIIDGKVKPMIDPDCPYKLENYLNLYDKSMNRRAHGKLIIKLVDNDDDDDEKYDTT